MAQDLIKAAEEPMELLTGLITRAHAKRFKEAIMGLIDRVGVKSLQDLSINHELAIQACHATNSKLNSSFL
ncbi:hypothetical protein GOBAR_DD14718 [Gossypium barbadense]|nr:hypothetical protein GOBAR_DD14718 [Gossypium barbadense]